MSPTPKTHDWSLKTSQQQNRGPSSLGWTDHSSNNGSSNTGWGGANSRESNGGSSSLGWSVNVSRGENSGFSSLNYSQANSSFVNVGSSNNNESLPKFTDTFGNSGNGNSGNFFKLRSSSSSEFSWSGSSSRRNSSEHGGLFGDPKKKVDWDGLVDNVFKEEIAKLSDKVQNKK
eukprot:GFUD01131515.1.p1 GENE.GFUD01131515.1~~GFUD01131515.1.p1  ORF type:complete len:174 (+),score=46.42 GFUD01131515.1:71-592(+)